MIRKSYLLLLLAAAGLLPLAGGATSEPEESIRPRWQVGDRWTVETATRAVQSAETGKDRRTTVRWQFQVRAIEKLDGRDCFRIEAAPQDGPPSTLWIDRHSLRVCQIQAGIVVGGQVQTLTENYVTAGGQAAPVFSPLPALPVDLPAFPAGQTKSLGTFTYEAVPGVAGQKASGDIGFAVSVQQEFSGAADPLVKSLATDPFVKDLGTKPTVGVRLKGPYGQVQQLWKPGVPWPVCSENGTTTARLVEFQPAGPAGEVQP
ncbi:hypothetical protein H8E07_21005 [bacterium]|nr:hypothetical protein [bacterium]